LLYLLVIKLGKQTNELTALNTHLLFFTPYFLKCFKYFAAKIVKQVHTYIYDVLENGKMSTSRGQESQKHDTQCYQLP